ncbi:DUF2141 domain-containing protein [Ruegeria sp. Ofav3-42]|uniref:DUF2141 domain-containing protein n=1 Tax=Ruegeria sp. Ofav3-42 TaxID=2917759 RepID=UPI001EF5CAC0|nr:DUF2141 domain-containing protein [Ruegeria sp. Ofav3-42]MCG7520117.1 DUF2141 domain-containing protein [Ruegeria sp. Ofav3-42]
MPSNTQRIVAAIVTAGLFVGGAWVASGFSANIDEAAASTTGTSENEGLTVNLHGARSTRGNVIVMAFDQQTAFDNMDYTKAAGYLEAPASEKPLRFDFPDLESGYFAIIAFHDENGDYDLNYDANYMPTEGYAVSGMNDLNETPVFEYSLIGTDKPTDMTLFYWP